MKNFLLDNFDIFRGVHEGSWALLAIFFLITVLFYKTSKNKLAKISHMVLRLFYVLMILSGLSMITALSFPYFYTIKAILMIGSMEICVVKMKKNSPYILPLILSIILLIIVFLMGYGIISF